MRTIARRPGALLLLLTLASASACATRHQTVRYTPLVDQKFRPRGHAAEVTELSPEALVDRGYVRIGTLAVIRVTSICYETCKKITHKLDTTTTLLKEAGKRGGDYVVLVRDNAESSRDVTKGGRCLESYIQPNYNEVYVPSSAAGNGAGRFVTVVEPVEVCTRFETLHGTESFEESSGSVWRRAS